MQSLGKGEDGRRGGWQVGRGGKISESEHGAVTDEEGKACVHELSTELFNFDFLLGFGHWGRGIDRGKVTRAKC